jgi:pSer/pThr/pTyr-binding forkhead associated (FHA) protein
MDKTDIFSNTDNFLKSKVYLRVFEENQFRFREWVRVERFPFYGGRDWGQDFLLDHPSVSRQHFVLEKNPVNQTIFLRNLSKTNGMTQQGRSIDYIELKGTTTVMMGGVKIEFLCASHFIDEPTREIDLKELLQREYSLKTVLFMVTQEILLLTFL